MVLLTCFGWTEMLLNMYLSQQIADVYISSVIESFIAVQSTSILFTCHKAENFVTMGTKSRAGTEAMFHLSYSLSQLESPVRPLSPDDMLIPDHKANRETQCVCCHRNKA